MSLRNKSLNINSRKTLALILTVALAMATLGVLLALAPAKAQGTITLSSSNLNPYKILSITIRGDYGDGPLALQVLDPYGQPVTVKWANGISSTYFYAYKVAAYLYVAYLKGPNATDPQYPSPPLTPSAYPAAFANVTFTDANRGKTYKVWLVGTDLEASFTYDTVAMTLTISPKEFAYRREATVLTLTISDMDLNLDPTKVDVVDASYISANVTLYKATGGASNSTNVFLSNFAITSVTETSVNSGVFTVKTNITKLNNLLGTYISSGDTLVITLWARSGAQGWDDKVPPTYPVDQRGSDSAKAIYRPPTVSVSFTSQCVVIDITSPDDNTDPDAIDNLDPYANVTIVLYDKNWNELARISPDTSASTVPETGKNTNTFEIKIPAVSWGTSASLSTSAVVLPTGMEGPFYLWVRYYVTTRPAGYNIDARGTGTYTPEIASLEVVKATTKTIAFTVKDADLNNRGDIVEYLDAYNATYGITLTSVEVVLRKGVTDVAKLVLLDTKGAVVRTKAPVPVSSVVSFVETGLNTGVFDLKINAAQLVLTPGAQYVLRYYDYTGNPATKYKDYLITISVIGITLDRTEIPVNRNGVVVYVTYANDEYNVDPTARNSATVNATIYAADGSTIWSGQIPLTETGINTGVFFKAWPIGADVFATPRIVDGKLVIFDPNYPDMKVEAKFRAHDASIEVAPSVIYWGDKITIKVKDPDANVDSQDEEAITIDILRGTQVIMSDVKLTETDVNSGEFVGEVTVSWDKGFSNVPPATVLTVKYVDRTPIMSPTASSWMDVPYVATFKVASTDGVLTISTAVEGYLGVLEELKLNNITVVDRDMNFNVLIADELTDKVAVSIEGVAEAPTYTLKETEANSGNFVLPKDTTISLANALRRTGVLTGTETSAELAAKLAAYVGKKVAISYIDDYSAAGARNIVTKTLTLKAWNAEITTSASAVNLGDWLTITIRNPEIAGTTIVAYKQVIVKSTTYPAGIVFYAEEVSPGVFQLKLQAISPADWVPGAKQIPVKLGDTITIEYVDPVTEDGKANVLLTKTVVVGVPVERPVPASEQKFLDVTGAEKKAGKVGETVMLSAKVQNVDVIDREFTAIFQVKDERGAVVYIAWVTAKLAPGTSMTPAVSWTPAVKGAYTVEVLVVKSIAEPTPYSDKISAPFTVQ
jgi:hypothetical protein